MNIGEYIKQYMKDKGIKQIYVAEKIGISPQVLGTMLNGTRKIEITEFFKICEAMQADPLAIAIAAGIYNVKDAQQETA